MIGYKEIKWSYLFSNDDFILVTANCGASVAENCTYFESAGGESGLCTFEILIRNYH